MAAALPIDEDKLNAFMGQFVGDLGAAMTAPLVLLGDRLGLYKAMADSEPVTPAELAERTGCRERYVREWLCSQAASGYVEYDAETETFRLPPEQAMALADENSPAFIPGAFQIVSAVTNDQPQIAERFRSGRGLRLARAPPRPVRGHGTVLPSRLPREPGRRVAPRPGRRRRQADRGRARGRHRLRSRRVDDPHGPGVSELDVRGLGLPRRVDRDRSPAGRGRRRLGPREVRRRLGPGLPRGPVRSRVRVRRAARHGRPRRGGASRTRAGHRRRHLDGRRAQRRGPTEDNLNPVGRIFYAASTMLCTPASLSQDVGLALGAQAGEARLTDVLNEGGFTRVRRAAETPFNIVLEARP